ncbi:thiol reductant ABC exporter subunit CydC [Modestobacter sp. Leaf380]|uniref:thiol reductant ABC exporter subunit CydC n=1 Tax=Modestobacter sp. Leaf380 TaxID=1736356 RepID=UPI0009EC8566|nr:thiol reductant ABC exporter subunit CydC [Modestobacter sp. Leaf380]
MSRGPLGPLDGVPGVRGALVRAAVAAVLQTVGLVLLSVGLAHAVARVVDGDAPWSALGLAAVGAAVRAVAGSVGEVLAARDARRSEDALRTALLDRLASSPAAVEAAGGPGPAAVLATTRLHDLGPSLATYLPALAQTLVVPPVLLLVLAGTDLLSAVLVAVTLPLVPVFMVLVGKYTADQTSAAARALDRIAGHVAELVRGLPVLTGLGRAADQAAALSTLGARHRSTTMATLRLAFLSSLVLELIATLSVALVAVTVGLRLLEGHLALAVGLTALLLAPEAFAPLRALGSAFHANSDAGLAAAEARAVLAVPAGTDRSRGDDDAALVLTDLSVAYPGRSVPALPATSLTVRPGELVALTGPSGSGKSTLLAAVAGALPPVAEVTGTVTGVPAALAYAPQHPRTVGDTVAEELRRHAGIDPADPLDAIVVEGLVVDALARVGAGALAGRRCTALSPGELQRVAVARALLRVARGASLLLLDEPTAHLDAAAAALVAEALQSLRGAVTVVVVTHDPALAALADCTVALPGTTAPVVAPSTRPVPVPVAAPEAAATGEPGTGAATEGLTWPRRSLVRAVVAGTLTAGSGVALTGLSGWLIVRASELPPVLTLLTIIVGVRAFGLSRALLRWWERMTAHDAALRLAESTRVRVWQALARQGIAAERTPGSALGRVVGDVGALQDLSVRVLTPPLVAGATVLLTAGALAFLSPTAAAGVLGVLALVVAAVVALHRRVDAGLARDEAALRVATLRETATLLDGIADLRVHGVAAGAVADVRALAGRQGVASGLGTRAGAWSSAIVTLGTGLAAVVGAALAWTGGLSGPAVAVVALAPLALAEPLTGLVGSLQRRGAWADARGRVEAVLAAPVAADPVHPTPVPRPVATLRTTGLVAGWPGGPDVLHGLDLTADRDGWVVVRGPSGSGKSTLLAVLLAALRPRAGACSVGGVDSTRVTGADLRTAFAWLPQESHVFASSIRANLALAGPRGTITDEAAHAALAAVGLGPLVAGLPEGLDTPVGSGGTALSGGERRRLAAARALLADRDVVLLDEPTAHLDPPTARALVADLRRVLAGRVVVCVTHDDAVAAEGDTVVALDERSMALAGQGGWGPPSPGWGAPGDGGAVGAGGAGRSPSSGPQRVPR